MSEVRRNRPFSSVQCEIKKNVSFLLFKSSPKSSLVTEAEMLPALYALKRNFKQACRPILSIRIK